MKISSINSYKPNFGFDKQLNRELRQKLENYPDKYWAATINTMNTQCNAIENTLFLEEAKGKSSRLEDYADIKEGDIIESYEMVEVKR